MKKIIIVLSILAIFPGFGNSQVSLEVSNDTNICMGTSAMLEAMFDTTLYNTNTYDVYVMPFTPVLPPTGTSIAAPNPLIDDRYYGPKPIGFNFCFFGAVYTQFYTGANGWISFTPLSSATYDPWVTQPIPNTDASRPRAAVMFPYRDWHPGVSGNILYDCVGTAPNRRLIISYLDVALFSCTSSHGNFQCVLHETTNIIDVNLLNCPTCPTWNSGNGVLGIQNAPGTVAYVVPGRNNTNWTAANETWRFAPNGLPQPQDIVWTSNPAMTPVTAQSLLVQPMVTTTYTATYQPCGVTLEADVVVTPEMCGTLTGAGSHINCFGASTGTATVTISDGIAPFDFTWSSGGGPTIGTMDSVNTINNLTVGSYTVTVSALNGAYELIETFFVTQNPQIFVDVGSLPETCPGASDGIITISTTNGFSPFVYSCSTQPNSPATLDPTYSFTGLPTGNYLVTVTDTYGCQGTGEKFVSQLSMQFATEQSEISCYGDTNAFAAMNVTGGTLPYTYQWSNGGNTPGITNLAAGCYQVTVLDANACEISSEVCFEEPPPILLYTSADQNICYSNSANIVSAVAGGTPPYSYLWSPTGYGSPSITITPPISTQYCLNVTDINGCISTQRCVSIFVSPPLEIDAFTLNDTICKGDTTTLFAHIEGGNGGPYFYELFQGPIIDPPLEVSPELTTKYIIVGQDGCGTPTVADTVLITVLPAPIINITSNVIKGCQPLEVLFTENTDDDGQTYFWDFGDSEMFNYSIEKDPVYIFRNAGIFEVNITVTSPWNCVSTQKLHEDIVVYPKPVSVFISEPQTATIVNPVINFDNNSIDAQQWFWSFGDGDSVMIEYPLPHYYPPIPEEYLVALITESDMGCRDTAFQVIKIEEHEDIFYVPNAFNPYSAVEQNQVFKPIISLLDQETFHMYIYDRWGELIYETTDYDKGWNGRALDNKDCKIGAYTWLVIYRDLIGVDYKKTGNVIIIQ